MGIFSDDASEINMARVMATVTLQSGRMKQWPLIRTYETEVGELAIVEEQDCLLFLLSDHWERKPRYVQALVEGKYGSPSNVYVGRGAIAYLAHRYLDLNSTEGEV